MLLSKTFNYLAPNGKLEITTFKISPSGLKRANVPDKLVNAYDLANDRLQVLAGLEKRSAKEEQESKQYSAERNAALEAIETFLSEQEMRQQEKDFGHPAQHRFAEHHRKAGKSAL